MVESIHRAKLLRLIFAVCSLSGCSTVGPGLAHHPLDCAIGIAWADCLAGTPGYNNGGGQQTRAEEAKQQSTVIAAQAHGDAAQCASDMQSPDLDPIRHNVELLRESPDSPPPFEIASNDTFPSSSERTAIAKWATARDECTKRAQAASSIPPSAIRTFRTPRTKARSPPVWIAKNASAILVPKSALSTLEGTQ